MCGCVCVCIKQIFFFFVLQITKYTHLWLVPCQSLLNVDLLFSNLCVCVCGCNTSVLLKCDINRCIVLEHFDMFSCHTTNFALWSLYCNEHRPLWYYRKLRKVSIDIEFLCETLLYISIMYGKHNSLKHMKYHVYPNTLCTSLQECYIKIANIFY